MNKRLPDHKKTSLQASAGPEHGKLAPRPFAAEPSAQAPGISTVSGHRFEQVQIYHTVSPAAQTKLSVSQPGDLHEQEAERVSDQVMRMDEASKPLDHGAESAETANQSPALLPEQMAQLSGLSGGQPLDTATREFMEPRFGHDFSRVTVHTDSQAAAAAIGIGARAYTLKNQIAFAPGQFVPQTAEGKRLIAHELTHVVQQQTAGSGSSIVQRAPFKGLRRWIGRNTGIAIGASGKEGKQQYAAAHQTPVLIPIDMTGNDRRQEKAPSAEAAATVDDYAKAYSKARLYHGTYHYEEVEKEGLLTKHGGTGMNNAPNRKNRVFLGHKPIISEGYGKGKGLGRVFLGPERTQATMDTKYNNNEHAYLPMYPIPEEHKGEMFRDPENPGAYFTERDIPPEDIFFGEDLLGGKNADHILQTIGKHMQQPVDDIEVLRELHQEAVRLRRISFTAGDMRDNGGSEHTKQPRKPFE